MTSEPATSDHMKGPTLAVIPEESNRAAGYPEAPRRPKIMTREEAKQLRKGMKAPRLDARVAGMKEWAKSFLEPEVGTQVLAHLESIEG